MKFNLAIIVMNSMAMIFQRRFSYRYSNNCFDDLNLVITILLLFTVCCMCDGAFVLTK